MWHPSFICWLLTVDFCLPVYKLAVSEELIFLGGERCVAANIVIYIENKFGATNLQVLKACRRSGGIAPPTLQLSVRWRCVFSWTLMPFCTRWYRTGSWLDRQPGRTIWRGENLLFQPRIESGIVQTHEYLINVIASVSCFLFGAPWKGHGGCKINELTVTWLWQFRCLF